MREGLKGLLEEKLITVLFPRRCPVCEEIVVPKGRKICPACRGKLSYVSGPFCLKCGKELTDPEGEYCLDCKKHRRTFDKGMALLNYNQASARSMARIKYKNKREYLDFYSEEILSRLGRKLLRLHADALVPVKAQKLSSHPGMRRCAGKEQENRAPEGLNAPA